MNKKFLIALGVTLAVSVAACGKNEEIEAAKAAADDAGESNSALTSLATSQAWCHSFATQDTLGVKFSANGKLITKRRTYGSVTDAIPGDLTWATEGSEIRIFMSGIKSPSEILSASADGKTLTYKGALAATSGGSFELATCTSSEVQSFGF